MSIATRLEIANAQTVSTLCVVTEREVHSAVPRIIQDKSTERLSATEGSDLTLECAAEGFPVPHINWKKYGGQLPVGRYSVVLGLYVYTHRMVTTIMP